MGVFLPPKQNRTYQIAQALWGLISTIRVEFPTSYIWDTTWILSRPVTVILYLNDFESCLKSSKANLYADDADFSFSSNEPSEATRNSQAELTNNSEWMRMNRLGIHPDKTEFMVIDHPQKQSRLPELPTYYLDNIRIHQVHKMKFLGLTADDNLSWNKKICQRDRSGWPAIAQDTEKHFATISVA